MPESSSTPQSEASPEAAPAAGSPHPSKGQDPATDGATDFAKVFAKEVDVIAERRLVVGLDADALIAASREPDGPKPAAGLGLIGLCLSGGGIRSASFSLGVLQALEHAKLSHHFDYLSTVSGGGFTGATLTSATHHSRLDNTPFALCKSSTSDAAIITHLRNQSSYLNPGGFLDTVRLPAIMVRGLALNLLALVPWLFLAALLTEVYYLVGYKDTTAFKYLVDLIPMLVGGIPFLILLIASPVVPRLERRAPHWRERYEKAFASSVLLLVLGVLSRFALSVVNFAIENPVETKALAATIATCWLVALGALVIAYRSVAARGAKRALRQLVVTGTGLLVPLGLFYVYVVLSIQLTPVPYFQDTENGVSTKTLDTLLFRDLDNAAVMRWLDLHGGGLVRDSSQGCNNKTDRPETCNLNLTRPKGSDAEATPSSDAKSIGIDHVAEATPSAETASIGHQCIDLVRECGLLDQCDSCKIAVGFCTPCVDAETCRADHGCDPENECEACTAEQGLCTATWRLCEQSRLCCWHTWDIRSQEWHALSLWGHGEASLSKAPDRVSLSIHRLPPTSLALVKLAKHITRRDKSKAWTEALDREDWLVSIALALSLFAFLLSLVTDANSLSLHGFYRDRLARAFVVRGRTKAPEGFDSASRLLLSDLAPERSGAPYPLLNATLNLSGGIESSVRFRKGSAFVFSPQFVGSQATGYVATRAMEAADPELTLASATAISAAAAGPNMGSFTSGSLAPLFALFNLRLGYWLVHPRRATNKWLLLRKPGNSHILREALGLINHHGNFVNVSDGGHFENLGAYELVRRKCRLIVVVDSEEDSLGQLKGLMTLTRLARIDFGAVITADLSAFHPSEANKTSQPWLWATIHYGVSPDGKDEVGYLLYIKANMVAGVPHYVDAYRVQSPDFPHESTADQFFNEVQFECYRALGYHLGGLVTKNQQLLDQITDVLESAPAPSRAFGRPSA